LSLQSSYPASKRTNKISELIEQFSNWNSIEHDGWHLPGTLEPHEWCGKWSTLGCLNVHAHQGTSAEGKGYVKTFQRHCYRANCEVCCENWRAREANKATRRIEKYEKLSDKPAKHIIISPPSWLHNKSKKELANDAYKILKDLDCVGGTIIFHPFRKYKTDQNLNSCFTWYYSPHFHVIGFGWIENPTENYQKNGWFVKNKGVRDSTFATFYYQLSHAGIKKHNHTLVWFGDLSYSKLKIEKEEIEANICPYCKAKLREVESYGLFYCKPPELEVELLVDVIGWRYVERKSVQRIPLTKEERYEYALKRELYSANNGVSLSC